ncbi:MAG: hypothetical protein K2X93_06405 [Candidatus Obscuribacterales bacterium]|nr:hypothetical protein [Candidatus Obscuribacterales bacterium]
MNLLDFKNIFLNDRINALLPALLDVAESEFETGDFSGLLDSVMVLPPNLESQRSLHSANVEELKILSLTHSSMAGRCPCQGELQATH